MKGGSRLWQLVTFLVLCGVCSCGNSDEGGGESLSSIVKYIMKKVRSRLSFFSTTYLYVVRTGPSKLVTDDPNSWGLVSWGDSYDSKYPLIDGLYEAVQGNPYEFVKTKSDPMSRATQEETVALEGVSSIQHVIQFHKDSMYTTILARDKKSKETYDTQNLLTQRYSSGFTLSTCRDEVIHVIYNQNGVEVARARCHHSTWWDTQSKATKCLRYSSGLTKTVLSHWEEYGVVGERDVLYHGPCKWEDTKYPRQTEVPFRVEIHSSYDFLPGAELAAYPINGEYALKGVGAYFLRTPAIDSLGRTSRYSFSWDRLEIVEGDSVVKMYHLPKDNYLVYQKCLEGHVSSLWDPDIHREVARIACEKPKKRDVVSKADNVSCRIYPSGRMDTFYSKAQLEKAEELFSPIKFIHAGICKPEELKTRQPSVGVGRLVLVLLSLVTSFSAGLVFILVILSMRFCCYSKTLPVSRRRAAGFKAMVMPSDSFDGDSTPP